MNPFVGFGLAALALYFGWRLYALPGLALGATLIVFWLVLQFNRSVRVMRNASESPLGHVASAVMFNAKLRPRMQMLQVISLSKSLGQRRDGEGNVLAWADDGGSEVVVTFDNGRIKGWVLNRPDERAE
jgi:uncharacterized protein (DUF58 family)